MMLQCYWCIRSSVAFAPVVIAAGPCASVSPDLRQARETAGLSLLPQGLVPRVCCHRAWYHRAVLQGLVPQGRATWLGATGLCRRAWCRRAVPQGLVPQGCAAGPRHRASPQGLVPQGCATGLCRRPRCRRASPQGLVPQGCAAGPRHRAWCRRAVPQGCAAGLVAAGPRRKACIGLLPPGLLPQGLFISSQCFAPRLAGIATGLCRQLTVLCTKFSWYCHRAFSSAHSALHQV
jgi:hypothetical protein